jgi:hypothetical protein
MSCSVGTSLPGSGSRRAGSTADSGDHFQNSRVSLTRDQKVEGPEEVPDVAAEPLWGGVAVTVGGRPGSGDIDGAFDGATSGWLPGSPVIVPLPVELVCPAGGRMLKRVWPFGISW